MSVVPLPHNKQVASRGGSSQPLPPVQRQDGQKASSEPYCWRRAFRWSLSRAKVSVVMVGHLLLHCVQGKLLPCAGWDVNSLGAVPLVGGSDDCSVTPWMVKVPAMKDEPRGTSGRPRDASARRREVAQPSGIAFIPGVRSGFDGRAASTGIPDSGRARATQNKAREDPDSLFLERYRSVHP